MVKLELPDGSKKDFKDGITAFEIVKGIGPKLAKDALCASLNDELIDLSVPIKTSGKFKIITFKDPEGVDTFRHSCAHIMAQAIMELFPKAKLTIGPVVEEGFYYDVDIDEPFKPEDLPKIEKKMEEIVKQDLKFERREISKEEAKKIFKHNPYKIELIEELDDVIVYQQGKFLDLCRGPHVPSTSYIKAFRLNKISGAYWHGDVKNKQLQRVYGICFPDKKLLQQHNKLIEEAKKRDHRKIGRDMNLFSIHDEAPGMPFFHDKGNYIFTKLVEYMTEELRKLNYEINKTPIILNKDLWLRSGHWDHYRENMYFTKIDEGDFAVKPMNCPGNLLVFKSRAHSYRELPIKAGEFGLVHRHELSGVLSGLFRVRVFTQDDAHVFCTEDQLHSQIIELLDLVDKIYSTFGFEYSVELSTKPEKAMGDSKKWEQAEEILAKALKAKKIDYKLNPGDGAFYGPKIDFHLKDTLGRTWQCGTIQLDFQMPEKFDLNYEGSDGKKHRPVMLHRAIYGSVERFMGILIEHYAGRFPLWLSPVQVKLLTVANRFDDYAKKIQKDLFEFGVRVEADFRAESISKKVREAQMQQIPLIIIIGEKEVSKESVAVRTLDGKVKYDYPKGKLVEAVMVAIEKRLEKVEL
ncbi:threonine--tRNA ligase [Nanoarchaeota archaeon]